MAGVTGIFFLDGAKLFDDRGPSRGINRISFYRTALLPSFGLTLPGLESRLNVTGWNYFVNANRRVASGAIATITNRGASFVPRGTLNAVSGDATPVLILNLLSGDFNTKADYDLQWRAESISDSTRVEKFPVVHIEIKEIV